jgi:hypothetical protein
MTMSWKLLLMLQIAVIALAVVEVEGFVCNISSAEMTGLQAFFDAAHGDEWYSQQPVYSGDDLDPYQTMWKFPSGGMEPCSIPWYGLTCTPTPGDRAFCGIVEISLTENNLRGLIPSEIAMLTNLLILNLEMNNITGTLPVTLPQLVNLQSLQLYGNSLAGTIGSEIYNLPNLLNLQLSTNKLEGGIPTEMGTMTSVSILDLSFNFLGGAIPTWLAEMHNLKELSLDFNYLTGQIPTEIGLLRSLTSVSFSYNSLTGMFPTEFAQLRTIVSLQASSNNLDGPLPDYFGNLRLLQQLYLGANFLTGSMDFIDLSALTNLEDLDVSGNQLTGTISIYVNMSNSPMQYLEVCCNYFTGPLNFVWMSSTSMGLDVSYNYLTGTINPNIAVSTGLEDLSFDYNLLTSTLPTELGLLTKMNGFAANNNLLTGPIPSEFGHFGLLFALFLGDNSLSRSIPSEIFLAREMSELYMNNNRLTGTLSPLLADLEHALEISFASNCLTGSIPSRIGGPDIERLTLNDNLFTGPISSEIIISVDFLCIMSLYSNMLTGTMDFLLSTDPQFHVLQILIGDNLLTGLLPKLPLETSVEVVFGIDSNYMTGTIPRVFLSLLPTTIIMNANFFSGSLPAFSENASIDSLVLDSNLFSGTISSDYEVAYIIKALNVANNSLTGSIPSHLFRSSRITSLILSNNSLHGAIHDGTLGDFLIDLDLSFNNLNGTFPFFNLGLSLTTLSIQSNSFSGEFSVACPLAAQMNTLLIGNNSFTGNLSTLSCFSNLTVISVESNSFVGNLDFLENMSLIEQVVVNQNQLTGTLPASLSTYSQLKAVIVADNLLHGRVDGAFNATFQKLLTAVDISSNDFSGPIPTSVFELPNLESFASIKTCFSGSLPMTLCICSSLKVLLLDGVTSGISCQRKFEVDSLAKSDAYVSRKGPLNGQIPSCIWTDLPLLTTLHLSSNGLTGTIGPPTDGGRYGFGSNLTNIVLSYNQLSGTIPELLFSLPYNTLELSNNRFKGVVEGVLANNDAVVYLQNNRLSGFLPSSFANASGDVNIMQGNLFNCNRNHPKPGSDTHAQETSCGSAPLDDALVVWGILATCFCLGGVLLWVIRPTLSEPVCKVILQVRTAGSLMFLSTLRTSNMAVNSATYLTWFASRLRSLSRSPPAFSSLVLYTVTLQQLFSFQAIFFVSVSVVLCIPCYTILKFVDGGRYSTHTYQYQWLVSATFLTGIPPAIFIICLWLTASSLFVKMMIFLPGIVRAPKYPCPSANWSSKPVDSADLSKLDDQLKLNWRRLIGCSAFVLIHFSVMSCLNGTYLYIILSGSYSVTIMTVSQVSLSIFKVLWELTVIPSAVKVIKRVSDGASESAVVSHPILPYLMLRFCCSVLSTIVIPFLVSVCVNSLCFLDLFVPQAVVSENFLYNIANRVTCVTVSLQPVNVTTSLGIERLQPPPVTDCLSFGNSQDISTQFYPPFTYSFQCGSSILTSYIPVLIYGFTFRLLILGLQKCYGLVMARPATDQKNLISSQPSVSDLLHGGHLVTSLLVYVLEMLTFGLASPPLAGIGLFCVSVELCAHYVFIVDALPEQSIKSHVGGSVTVVAGSSFTEELELAVTDLWKLPRMCMWSCVHLASVFWALMVFDMIGDTEAQKPQNAWWGPFLVLVIPLLVRGYMFFKGNHDSTLLTDADGNYVSEIVSSDDIRRIDVRSMIESVDVNRSTERSRDSLLSMNSLSRPLIGAIGKKAMEKASHIPSEESNSQFV